MSSSACRMGYKKERDVDKKLNTLEELLATKCVLTKPKAYFNSIHNSSIFIWLSTLCGNNRRNEKKVNVKYFMDRAAKGCTKATEIWSAWTKRSPYNFILLTKQLKNNSFSVTNKELCLTVQFVNKNNKRSS